MDQRVTCLVTIHGIGFQQPPLQDGTPGYADGLHERLHKYLGSAILSDDPGRQRSRPGEAGPIYVQSHWPPGSISTEPGLARLGTWTSDSRRTVDGSNAPLTDGRGPQAGVDRSGAAGDGGRRTESGRVAHVALVYSRLQDQTPHPGSAVETLLRANVNVGHYTSVVSMIRMGLMDVKAIFAHHGQQQTAEATSLRTRSRILESLGGDHPAKPAASPVGPQGDGSAGKDPASGVTSVIGTLENDVATYVCRNDLRERVRSFVHDAILRLGCRDDVGEIVINAHSQGTVLAYDVLRTLPPFAAQKVRWLVTAGSPLRKYVDLFTWGNEVGCINKIGGWTNFWDEKDPVADPLMPPPGWKASDKILQPPEQMGLFQSIDAVTGVIAPVAIDDQLVDNLAHSVGGGLQAHNYWDNELQVVKPLAEILEKAVATAASQTAV